MNNTSDIENYPGYANISGPELAEKCLNRLKILELSTFMVMLKMKTMVILRTVMTDDQTYEDITSYRSTGSKHRPLGVPGEEELKQPTVFLTVPCWMVLLP